jgi:hypothetical protein
MRLFLATLLSCAALTSQGQKEDAPGPTNTVFLEGLGQAIYWSANFEHTEYASERLAMHLRFGLSFWSENEAPNYIGLPITFSLSYGDIHRAEAGAGFLFFSYGGNGPFDTRMSETLMPTWHAGYRMQKEYGGLFLRAGLMVANIEGKLSFQDAKSAWAYNPYVSVGSTF